MNFSSQKSINTKNLKTPIALIVIMALISVHLFAIKQTGNLVVLVSSEDGQPLSGARVALFSTVLLSTKIQITAGNGKATFRNLTPGTYSSHISLDGFQPAEIKNVAVGIHRTSRIKVTLKLGQVTEAVTVMSITPIVDPSSSTVTTEFDFQNFINHMPTTRHYDAIMILAGGVNPDRNPTVLGGGSYNNLYLADGIPTNDFENQTWGSQFNLDTIQAMSLMSAGIPAEYGYSMGGVMNMLTKSGSNKFCGTIRLQIKRRNWNDASVNNPSIDDDNAVYGKDSDDWDISGGGPVIPDLIWFYTGYSTRNQVSYETFRMNPLNENNLIPYADPYLGHHFSMKATVHISNNMKATILFKEDPIKVPNIGIEYYGSRVQPESNFLQELGGDSLLATATYVISDNVLLEGRFAADRRDINTKPQSKAENGESVLVDSVLQGPVFWSSDNWVWGSIIEKYKSDRNYDTFSFSLNWLNSISSFGEHDIKIGTDYLNTWAVIANTKYPSNEYIETSSPVGIGFENVRLIHRKTYENRLPAAESQTTVASLYLQDSMAISDVLTVNLGFRSDPTVLRNNQGNEIYSCSIPKTLAPRIGLAFNISGNVIRSSWGRYYDLMDRGLLSKFNVFSILETIKYWQPSDNYDGRNGWNLSGIEYLGQKESPHSIDPDLTPEYMDEFSLGADLILSESMAIGINGVWRTFHNLLVENDYNGDRIVHYENLSTDTFGTKYKEYLALIIDFRKRPSADNLFIQASLTFNNLTGIVNENNRLGMWGKPYQTNPLDWWGDRSNPTLDLKVQATYFFPNNWYLGLIFACNNGIKPSTKEYAYWPEWGWYAYYPNSRTDMNRLPTVYRLDLQFGIEQTFRLPFKAFLENGQLIFAIYANIYNLTNNQIETNVERWLSSDNYNEPISWQRGRSYLLGFRLEF